MSPLSDGPLFPAAKDTAGPVHTSLCSRCVVFCLCQKFGALTFGCRVWSDPALSSVLPHYEYLAQGPRPRLTRPYPMTEVQELNFLSDNVGTLLFSDKVHVTLGPKPIRYSRSTVSVFSPRLARRLLL